MAYDGIDTGSVLANRGLNGGFGFGFGNFSGDGSAVNANVTANRDLGVMNAINNNTSDQFLSNQISGGFRNVADNISLSSNFISDRIAAQSLNDRFATIERTLAADQASTQRQLFSLDNKLTECCCKLEAGQAAIVAKLDAQALAEAQSENQRLQLQVMINNQGAQSGN